MNPSLFINQKLFNYLYGYDYKFINIPVVNKIFSLPPHPEEEEGMKKKLVDYQL